MLTADNRAWSGYDVEDASLFVLSMDVKGLMTRPFVQLFLLEDMLDNWVPKT